LGEHNEKNPLHAPFCADRACQVRTPILENVPIARDTYRVRFACPTISKRIIPGQFVMMRLSGGDDPLLARPLALYDTVVSGDEATGIDIVYLVAGKFTRRLAGCGPGEMLDVWGPLGNGFPPQSAEHLIIVAGGIGQTPFLALAAEHLGRKRYGDPPRETPRPRRISFCYGARSADYLAGVDDFRRLDVESHLSTDDGTEGHRGFVTDLLRQILDRSGQTVRQAPALPGVSGKAEAPMDARPPAKPRATPRPPTQIVCCGPERMMEAVAEIAHQLAVPCQVSLETPMACGIGICFTCVAKVRQSDGSWDYKRTCVEGPIFDARQIVW
jgi:dihydroorotate dehydrogenase electron transfer subunit